MKKDHIEQHPNEAKFILCHKVYFALRYSLIKQISELENVISGTELNSDVSIKRHILPSLKRTLKGLSKRFEVAGVRIDGMLCAQKLMEIETQEIKEQPLRYCRYFKGETENRENKLSLLSDYEKCWLDSLNTNIRYLENQVCEYIHYNLMDFSDNDGVPISLKAILFNRYCHWNMADVESFKDWYLKSYLKCK